LLQYLQVYIIQLFNIQATYPCVHLPNFSNKGSLKKCRKCKDCAYPSLVKSLESIAFMTTGIFTMKIAKADHAMAPEYRG
jgi:hypothetical protein